jgi:hypothetical protein
LQTLTWVDDDIERFSVINPDLEKSQAMAVKFTSPFRYESTHTYIFIEGRKRLQRG